MSYIPWEELLSWFCLDLDVWIDNRTDLIRPALKMESPIGVQGVFCTTAENEDNISNPWLWMVQMHASAMIFKKSPVLVWLRKPTAINER
jgi:hypothetical protein